MAGTLSKSVPQDRYPEAVAWLFPLLGSDDRENVVRNFQMMMPPPVFAGVAQFIRKAIGDDWAELARRIPSLG